MFERYTEAARLSIFWALHHALESAGSQIETEHLLTGLLCADQSLAQRYPGLSALAPSPPPGFKPGETSIKQPTPHRDLPLSDECKRVLAYAAEESQRLAHRHIGTDHLLLGFLHEEGSSAARALHEAGLELSLVREQAGGQSQGAPETAYDELHRLIDELRPEHLEAAAQALRSLKSGAPLSASAVFVSPSLGESGTARAFAGAALGYGVFDRYTEQARRSIFFARYEASQFGTKAVESEHLLLGLLREHPRLMDRLHGQKTSALEIRKDIEQRKPPGPKTSTSVDLPLSEECKHAMKFAAVEARELKHRQIGSGHLLVGLLREEKCLAAELLRALGIDLDEARRDLAQGGST